jgi:hypothetical protein
MRPIHRPIHELAILPEIWDRMSADEKKTARNEGKIRLPVRENEMIKNQKRIFKKISFSSSCTT